MTPRKAIIEPAATAGSSGLAGSCPDGTVGSPSRDCNLDGTWGDISGTCATLHCQAQSFNNANWPMTPAGSSAAGNCDVGYAGSPSRACSSEGTWEDVEFPCEQLTCSALVDGNAEWPESASLVDGVSGTCLPGFLGAPTRSCDANGQWDEIEEPCTRTFCFFFAIIFLIFSVLFIRNSLRRSYRRQRQLALDRCRHPGCWCLR